MPRPRVNRRIHCEPPVRFYKPQGVPLGSLRGVTLTLEGLEAIRLADAEGLDHEMAAEMMGISRPTFSRLLAEARRIAACGLANGWAIRIDGGNYELAASQKPYEPGRHRCGGSGGRKHVGRRWRERASDPDRAPFAGGNGTSGDIGDSSDE